MSQEAEGEVGNEEEDEGFSFIEDQAFVEFLNAILSVEGASGIDIYKVLCEF